MLPTEKTSYRDPLLLEFRKQLDGIAPVGSYRPIAIRAVADRTVRPNEGDKINLARKK